MLSKWTKGAWEHKVRWEWQCKKKASSSFTMGKDFNGNKSSCSKMLHLQIGRIFHQMSCLLFWKFQGEIQMEKMHKHPLWIGIMPYVCCNQTSASDLGRRHGSVSAVNLSFIFAEDLLNVRDYQSGTRLLILLHIFIMRTCDLLFKKLNCWKVLLLSNLCPRKLSILS